MQPEREPAVWRLGWRRYFGGFLSKIMNDLYCEKFLLEETIKSHNPSSSTLLSPIIEAFHLESNYFCFDDVTDGSVEICIVVL
jgi:hypothetical protein